MLKRFSEKCKNRTVRRTIARDATVTTPQPVEAFRNEPVMLFDCRLRYWPIALAPRLNGSNHCGFLSFYSAVCN
jgi:hypothetical protein